MKPAIRSVLCIVFVMNSILAKSQNYQYQVDLTKKSFVINIQCPENNKDTVQFIFNTGAVHADVRIANYIDMVSSFEAFDLNGKLLKTKKDKKKNSFFVYGSENLRKIVYSFESSWQNKKWNKLFPPSGTCFMPDRMFYFTTLSLLGYFEGMENAALDLGIVKPADMKALIGIHFFEKDDQNLEFKNVTLKQLSESPFVFAKSETATVNVKGTEFMISTFSENRKSYTSLIEKELIPYLNAIGEFFPKMPVPKYNVVVYIKDVTHWGNKYRAGKLGMLSFFRMLNQLGKLGFGANGYGKGTSFCIADIGNDYYLMEGINSTLIHEFIHIVNPYQFFSGAAFDEAGSKNQWLWEGATEYFAQLAQLQSGLLTKKEFLNIIRTNIYDTYNFPANISMVELCENINKKPYSDHLMQVYWKGSVVAMLLDFEIMRLTDGEKTLKSVLFGLAEKYSSQKKSINENDVIPELVSSVKPELQTFFDRFVLGTDSLEINKGFDVIGFEYYKKFLVTLPSDPIWFNDIKTSDFMLPPDSKNPEYVITKVGQNDFVGFQKGDRVKRYDIFKSLTDKNGSNLPEGTGTQLKIIRNNKPLSLTYTIKYREGNYLYFTLEKQQKTSQQEKLLKIWLSN